MTDDETDLPPLPEDIDAVLDAIDHLGPASEDHGNRSHDLARAAARRAQAVRLRRDGATYEQIARLAGYSGKSAARQSVVRAFQVVEAESVRELRALENLRMDADEVVLRTLIADATLPARTRIMAIDSRTRLSARRARTNGTDAPIQVALSAGVAADLDDALAEAEAVLLGNTIPGEVTDVTDELLEG